MGADFSRRAVLAGGLTGLFAVACGCRFGGESTGSGASPPASPGSSSAGLPAELAAAAHAELGLITSYDEVLERAGGEVRRQLVALRRAHREHLRRLTAPAGPGWSGGVAVIRHGRIGQIGQLAPAERQSAAHLRRMAVRVADGPAAALLAGIAASHQAHAFEIAGIVTAAAGRGSGR